MSKNKWWSKDVVITLTAIKYCKLWYALKESDGQIMANCLDCKHSYAADICGEWMCKKVNTYAQMRTDVLVRNKQNVNILRRIDIYEYDCYNS